MPRYHNLPKNWEERGNFTITPCPFWRCLWPLKVIVPYYVGDRVKFHIHFDIPNLKTGVLSQVLCETFGDNTKVLCHLDESDKDIIGNIIDKEGDVTYGIGYFSDPDNVSPVFTTKVQSWDTIISQWWWVFVGAFFTLLCGVFAWLLNLIQINPYWKIWVH